MNLLDRILPRRDERYADRLFESLVNAHQLSRDDERLLLAIAEGARVVRAAEVFVRPSLFERSPDRSRWSSKDVDRLAARLFDRALRSGASEAPDVEIDAARENDPRPAESTERGERGRASRRIRWGRGSTALKSTTPNPVNSSTKPTSPELASSTPSGARPSSAPPAPPASTPSEAETVAEPPERPIDLETIEDPPGLAPTLRE